MMKSFKEILGEQDFKLKVSATKRESATPLNGPQPKKVDYKEYTIPVKAKSREHALSKGMKHIKDLHPEYHGHEAHILDESVSSGMSFNDAVSHAQKHGQRVSYGTETRKWHSIDKDHKDYHTSLDPNEAKRHGMAKSLLMSTQSRVMKEEYKVGDVVVPDKGPHAGVPHEVIHIHGNGQINIRPKGLPIKSVKYRLGAATAQPHELRPHLELSEGLKVGDRAHMGFGAKGGAGHIGTIEKIDGETVHLKLHDVGKFGSRVVKGSMNLVSPMQEGVALDTKIKTGINREVVQEAFKAAKKKNKTEKNIEVKGPGPDERFQKEPIVTPLTSKYTKG